MVKTKQGYGYVGNYEGHLCACIIYIVVGFPTIGPLLDFNTGAQTKSGNR